MTDTPAPPPASPPPPGPPPPPPPPGPEATWRDGLPDELKADATLGKFDSVEALARNALDLKRQLSADKVLLPKGDEDAEGWAAFFKAAGRPETPGEYKFPTVKEGEESPLATAFAPVAHEIGLNLLQVERLDSFLDEHAKAVVTAAETAAAEAEKALRDGFVERLGETGWREMETRARATAEALLPKGEDGADLADRLAKIVGDAGLIEFFDGLGKKMGEGRFRAGDPPDPLVDSDPVKQREELSKDEGFRQKLLKGDVEAKRKWDAVQAAVAAKNQEA